METSARRAAVLIIDDDSSFRQSVNVSLASKSVEVREAGSGADGISLAMSFLPQLSLVDLRLPDMDGLAVARRLVEAGAPNFLLVSGWLETQTVVEAMRLGALDVLDKPIMIDPLCALIDRHLLDFNRQPIPTFPRRSLGCARGEGVRI
jgi:two-component system KDP operon response regulator KdpE